MNEYTHALITSLKMDRKHAVTPEQGRVLQGSAVLLPLHGLPPSLGAGLLQARVRMPPPQDRLHDDHDDQAPSTVCHAHVKKIGGHNKCTKGIIAWHKRAADRNKRD